MSKVVHNCLLEEVVGQKHCHDVYVDQDVIYVTAFCHLLPTLSLLINFLISWGELQGIKVKQGKEKKSPNTGGT